jgi:hypothetical protein
MLGMPPAQDNPERWDLKNPGILRSLAEATTPAKVLNVVHIHREQNREPLFCGIREKHRTDELDNDTQH